MEELFVRYLHFIGIMILAAALVSEHLLLAAEMTRAQLRKVAMLDAVYGVSAVVVLVTGLLQWLVTGKPTEFYSENPIFHAKLGLFLLMVLLSIYPTLFFLRNRKGSDTVINMPKAIIMLIRFELLLLLIIPLSAVFMASGYGL